MRICNCVLGPPRGGVCMACGAQGEPWPLHPLPMPSSQPWPRDCFLTEAEIRRIVREELARAAKEPPK